MKGMSCIFIFLVRHGDYEDNKRAGWGDNKLTPKGQEQANALGVVIKKNTSLNVGRIYSSDLMRSIETAEPTASALALPIYQRSDFRAPNNGVLANMAMVDADLKYPNLHYYTLEYEEKYPNGESPREFWERICCAWDVFVQEAMTIEGNCILFSHSSVIRAVYCKVMGIEYNNKDNSKIIEAELLPIEVKDDLVRCLFVI